MAGIDEDDISDSSEDEAEAQPTAGQAKRPAIYNTEGLHEKLEDFGWSDQVDWLHTLAVTVSGSDEEPVDVENDLARELAFYTQALESAKEAYEKLTERGVPVLRPNDYYAEMVKTDDHMLKVKDKLLHEQKAIEEAEARRKQRENKKYGKEVQAAKLKERAQSKKKDIESVKKWRKQREKDDYEGGEEFQVSLNQEAEAPAPKKDRGSAVGAGRRGKGEFHTPSKKRKARDEKFGFGGSKKLNKQNDAMSSGDMDGYRGSFREGRGTRGGRGGKAGKSIRPGKSKRVKQKAK